MLKTIISLLEFIFIDCGITFQYVLWYEQNVPPFYKNRPLPPITHIVHKMKAEIIWHKLYVKSILITVDDLLYICFKFKASFKAFSLSI